MKWNFFGGTHWIKNGKMQKPIQYWRSNVYFIEIYEKGIFKQRLSRLRPVSPFSLKFINLVVFFKALIYFKRKTKLLLRTRTWRLCRQKLLWPFPSARGFPASRCRGPWCRGRRSVRGLPEVCRWTSAKPPCTPTRSCSPELSRWSEERKKKFELTFFWMRQTYYLKA